MRKRVPGYITKQPSNDFGMDIKVQRPVFDWGEPPPSGDPVPEGRTAIDENLASDVRFRNVIPPGEIGSNDDGSDLDILTPPQFVDTVSYYRDEYRDPHLHGAKAAIMGANPKGALDFQNFPSFTPRRAPLPTAAQDEGFLRIGAADPLMTDANRQVEGAGGKLDRTVYGKNLYGGNKDGVPHNAGHPGFKAVQGKVQSEGYSKKAAGAIVASAARNASKSAKKANPRLNKVRG